MTDQLKRLLDSYSDISEIKPNFDLMFPPKDRIKCCLDYIKNILFPGFFSEQALTESFLVETTKSNCGLLKTHLEKEIYNCLLFDLNADLTTQEKKSFCKQKSDSIVDSFFDFLPELRKRISEDAQALLSGDPAAASLIEVILSYPGFYAVMVYRVAHFFYCKDVPLIPRILTELAHHETGIDIHPGAIIGRSFCIDHGSGVVIGGTAIIGDFVKLYQGVTLGAFSVSKQSITGKRHPTVGDYVTIYAGSTILGGDTLIGERCIIGGNVWITRSVPPNSKLYLSQDFDSTYTLIPGK